MEETNKLQEKLESTLITKTFNVSGMPETIWRDVNDFCRENYGDSRWVMIADLLRLVQEDFKYALLYEEIQDIKAQLAELKQVKPEENKNFRVKTFGDKHE